MTDPDMKRKGILRLAGILAVLLAVCLLVSLLTAKWMMREKQWLHDQPHGHDWLQQELNLNEEELAAINAYEDQYRAERQDLLDEFNNRIQVLAQLLRTSDTYTEEVTGAIHHLHEVHGDIQILSIEHYYDMLSVLPPAKQDALRDIAVNALSQPE